MRTLLLTLLLLTGCAAPEPSANGDKIAARSYYGVKEIYLSDGTRCAVLWGSRQGSIDCDWSDKND